MALGQTNAAQVIVCKNKGWDPTKIEGGGDISGWDTVPTPWTAGDNALGKLPDQIPEQQLDFPGNLDQSAIDQQKDEFSHPDFTREASQRDFSNPRRTNGADPMVGGRGRE